MIVLKFQTFTILEKLTKFVNENNIKREDILEITHGKTLGETPLYTLFFIVILKLKKKHQAFGDENY
jgi:hypothetical protein